MLIFNSDGKTSTASDGKPCVQFGGFEGVTYKTPDEIFQGYYYDLWGARRFMVVLNTVIGTVYGQDDFGNLYQVRG